MDATLSKHLCFPEVQVKHLTALFPTTMWKDGSADVDAEADSDMSDDDSGAEKNENDINVDEAGFSLLSSGTFSAEELLATAASSEHPKEPFLSYLKRQDGKLVYKSTLLAEFCRTSRLVKKDASKSSNSRLSRVMTAIPKIAILDAKSDAFWTGKLQQGSWIVGVFSRAGKVWWELGSLLRLRLKTDSEFKPSAAVDVKDMTIQMKEKYDIVCYWYTEEDGQPPGSFKLLRLVKHEPYCMSVLLVQLCDKTHVISLPSSDPEALARAVVQASGLDLIRTSFDRWQKQQDPLTAPKKPVEREQEPPPPAAPGLFSNRESTRPTAKRQTKLPGHLASSYVDLYSKSSK